MCKPIFLIFAVILSAIALTSCSTLTADQYEATALTTYTWQIKYANSLASDQLPRLETFAKMSLLNRNGLKPEGAVTGPFRTRGCGGLLCRCDLPLRKWNNGKDPKKRQATPNC